MKKKTKRTKMKHYQVVFSKKKRKNSYFAKTKASSSIRTRRLVRALASQDVPK